MLVLSRKIDERIIIEIPPSDTPRKIEICVTDIRNDSVRRAKLGFDAAKHIKIYRSELEPNP